MNVSDLKRVSSLQFSSGQFDNLPPPVKVELEKDGTLIFRTSSKSDGIEIKLFNFNPQTNVIEGRYCHIATNVSDGVKFTRIETKSDQLVFLGKASGNFARARWYLTIPRDFLNS